MDINIDFSLHAKKINQAIKKLSEFAPMKEQTNQAITLSMLRFDFQYHFLKFGLGDSIISELSQLQVETLSKMYVNGATHLSVMDHPLFENYASVCSFSPIQFTADRAMTETKKNLLDAQIKTEDGHQLLYPMINYVQDSFYYYLKQSGGEHPTVLEMTAGFKAILSSAKDKETDFLSDWFKLMRGPNGEAYPAKPSLIHSMKHSGENTILSLSKMMDESNEASCTESEQEELDIATASDENQRNLYQLGNLVETLDNLPMWGQISDEKQEAIINQCHEMIFDGKLSGDECLNIVTKCLENLTNKKTLERRIKGILFE